MQPSPRRAHSVADAFRSMDRLDVNLWLLVLAVMAGDVALTRYGLSVGLIETNPIALFGIDTFGYAVLAYLKIPAFLLGILGWVILPEHLRRLNLVGLALPWAVATAVNLWLIASAL